MAAVLTRTVRVTQRFDQPVERVFAAWLDHEVAGRWLFATASRPIVVVDIDARVGGAFRFVDRRRYETIEHSGEYLEIVPPRRLVFTLSLEGEPAFTRVTVEIVRVLCSCTLALVHENVPQDRARDVEGRWCGMLYGLDEALASTPVAVGHRIRRPVASHPISAQRSAP